MALREFSEAGRIIVVAKHERQADIARSNGAVTVTPADALGAVRRGTRAFRLDPERTAPFLLGGVDVAFECVGSKASLDLALRCTRARGTVVLSGMPERADLSPAWFRELTVIGAYSGAGAFDDALKMADPEVGKLVGPAYPLSAWREGIDHALSAGSLGATKVAFDPRLESQPNHSSGDRSREN
jgi:threonine dehydrogenase-like Zn-dependent dehydrogenase